MKNRRWSLVVVLVAFGVALGGVARADGIVQNASKEAAKGAVRGVAQEANSGNLVNGAKQVTKGMMDGVSDAAPQMTSQIVNQANVNKKTMGKVARTVTGQAVAGAVDAGASSLSQALGADADSKVADAMVALTERMAAALVRGIKSEADVKIHVDANPWMIVLGVGIGAAATLVCSAGMLLLYLAFTRRRPAFEVAVPMRAGQPAGG